MTRTALSVASALSVLIVVVPSASADTTPPNWTCRASPAYIEQPGGLLGRERVEPLVANGVADVITPDRPICADATTGVQDTPIPPAPGTPLVTLTDASATTTIDPDIGAARNQNVGAEAEVTETTVTIGATTIVVGALKSEATGECNPTTGALELRSPDSTIASLTIDLGAGAGPEVIDLSDLSNVTIPAALTGILNIRFNQTPPIGTAPNQTLTRQALVIDVLNAMPALATKIVIGEVKVGTNGDVCATAQSLCPAGSVAQPGSGPLVCLLTQTAPCPAGSTADPNNGGACVIVRTVPGAPAACPAGTVTVPSNGACVLVLQRPCPAGAIPDPRTRVCVAIVDRSSPGTVITDRINGRIGSPNGPRATCGKVSMRFVRGGGARLSNKLGIRVVTRGRLVSCEKKPRPIVGARIDVIHVLPDGRRLRKTGLRSRGDGKLTLILPNDLRTRKIEYGYRPNLAAAKVSSKRTLSLTVRNRRGKVIR